MFPATAAAFVRAVQPSVVEGPAPSAGSSPMDGVSGETGWGQRGTEGGAGGEVVPRDAGWRVDLTIGAATPLSTEAAVEMTLEPEPGEPAMKNVSPEFPAEVTTMTPASAALSEAIALESSADPKATRATC